MTDLKISALTDGGLIQPDDELAVARSSTSYRALPVGADGWISDGGAGETWTYASGSGGGTATFTVSGDVTAKYTPGTRIKLTQTTVKYFVVVSSSFASSTTTVKITAGSDYTLANATISANYHSYSANPQGWPGWFNYSVSSSTGFTGALTVIQARFAVIGRTCFLSVDFNGTSNATTFTCPAPIAAVSRTLFGTIVLDNGGAFSGRADLPATSSTFTMGKDVTAAGGFTASGSKGVFLYVAYDI